MFAVRRPRRAEPGRGAVVGRVQRAGGAVRGDARGAAGGVDVTGPGDGRVRDRSGLDHETDGEHQHGANLRVPIIAASWDDAVSWG